MALDGVLLYGLSKELENDLSGGRVDKIQQPEKDEIHLTLRNKGNNYRLLMSASASHPRIHLTDQTKSNPMVPPMFCMVLRKHLSGGRLIKIQQPSMERILELSFEVINEIGDLGEKTLIIEIMGRHSNIILTNPDGTILDAIKHVDSSISRVREILPGRQYVYPPSQGKTNPLDADLSELEQKLQSSELGNSPVNILSKSYTGISKTTAEEILHRSEVNNEALSKTYIDFFSNVRNNEFIPSLLMDHSGKPKDILPMAYSMFDLVSLKTYSSFSKALDEFYLVRDKMERLQQRTAHLHRVISNNLIRSQKKLALYIEELEKAKDADMHRLYGELITSNIYQIPAKAESVTLLNYYESDNPMITIALDPTKTPAQNAQTYFKKYNKAKRTEEKQSRLMKETQDEIDYLETINQNLSMCTNESDIMAIREELTQEGYLKDLSRKKKNKGQQTTSTKPHHFLSADGFEIFVGKNNIQNDHLTLKTALPSDLWLHTKTIPGSHVIVKAGGQPISEATLLEAASLAAYYSKARLSTSVPVDYCPRKNVKKPNGAKPGMVIYEHNKTIFVTPSEEKVKKMKKL
ncbi:MAG: fibronectin/fibrinogen-binding protein [Clostridiales bacterium]|nr:fibronectin/fibrinogen-binding protein [Clostridiales bacterium]